MALLKNGAFASITKGMPNYDALPGLPLRTTIKIPGQGEITSTIEASYAISNDAPEFVRQVTAEIMAGRGDQLPVSAFPLDGT